ncbi:MAG: YitT family protein [Alistipes sp.]|jgi:uncharacterized membrane-anchored protein YitT (DUF2179 family)|nr:YitT family protein [Alistipes sp.]
MKLYPKTLFLNLKDDVRTWKWWSEWLVITLGCVIMALAFILFMYPYKITPGGVWGMSTVLHEIFPAVSQGWFGYMINIPLLLAGFAVFGGVFGAKTVYASLVVPFFMLVFPHFLFPDVAEQTAQTLLWGRLDLSQHLILPTIFGGILIGVAVGLVIRSRATTGGTDIVGMLIQRYWHIKFSTGIMMADAFVVMSSIVVLVGVKGESPTLPLYSMVAIYVAIKVIDLVVDGFNNEKILFIVTDRQEEVRHFILHELNRGGTVIKGSGLYTGGEKNMIFLVISQREIFPVKQRLREIDPAMFVVVADANETLGQGFRPWKDMKGA